jgi:proline iminopeptidase
MAGIAASLQRMMRGVTDENHITTADGIRLFFRKLGSGPPVLIPNGIIYLDDFSALAADRTLIAYDPRNRGRSEHTNDGDIHRDVEDLEAVRRHFGIDRIDLIGHSYVGLMVALYGMRYPAHVHRIVQIGPMQPVAGRQYPAHLTFDDGTMARVFGKLAQLQRDEDEVEMCRKAWAVLGALYVTDPADAPKIDWGRCELPNERSFLRYWTEKILPSIQSLQLAELASNAKIPVLTIHGAKDRNAAYGGGREWALMLPDARLLTIAGAAHAPWIEAPEKVFGAVRTFLDGQWPDGSEKVESLDPVAVTA